MPTYEYECGACGRRFDLFLPMSAKVVQLCPECGGEAKRLISAGGGLLFKGSGFYITDYRSKDYAAKAKAEASGGGGSGSGKAAGATTPASTTPPPPAPSAKP
jgi:putative FmdB family regulatory protein